MPASLITRQGGLTRLPSCIASAAASSPWASRLGAIITVMPSSNS
jgi:hypothetical protein